MLKIVFINFYKYFVLKFIIITILMLYVNETYYNK